MSGRPIISYDDITLPYDSQPTEVGPPPAKKPKTSNHQQNGHGRQPHPHWDDPTASSSGKVQQGSRTGSNPGKNAKKGGSNANTNTGGGSRNPGSGKGKTPASFSVNMSRELTREEIWDDSALVEAWDAAMEEYEAYNGPGKGWKEDPLVKSALWYNTPPKPNASAAEDEDYVEDDAGETYLEGDEGYYEEGAAEDAAEVEAELNHPTQLASIPANYDIASGPLASLSTVSQDEAFSRALNAMYWGGYWTAVYQCHRGQANPPATTPAKVQEKVNAMAGTGNGEEDDSEPGRNEDASGDNMNTL